MRNQIVETMKKVIFISVVAMLCGGASYGQQLPGDSLHADFRTLVRHLEQTHPDPYSAFGGKVSFHRKAHEIGQELKKGATRDEFAAAASAFLSTLGDGHTRISGGSRGSNSVLRLPLVARPAPDGMRVAELPERHRELLGSRVVSVDGVTIEELAERLGRQTTVENIFGAYNALSSGILMHRLITMLIPEVGDSVAVELETSPGATVKIILDYLTPEDYASIPMALRPKWAKVDQSLYMSYGFLDDGRRAMLFRMSSIQSREQFLAMRRGGWPGFEMALSSFYAQFLGCEMPADTDEAIAAVPSLGETFRAVLTEMKSVAAPYLIIDLRDNGGGWTPIVTATLYQMYGDRYLETDMGVRFCRMISPLYMQKTGMTLERFNAAGGSSYEYGDYTFGDDTPDTRPTAQKRRDFVENIFGGDPGFVADLDGVPVYTPQRVFVVTNDGTFSAAFHYAFYLWKMGATMVGIPSSQAPNAFMETTRFKLPYTGLVGSISNSVQMFLPDDDPRAAIFYPDIMLSPDDYRRYGFDRHAELLYLMDLLELNH